jgi:hypothetical protein
MMCGLFIYLCCLSPRAADTTTASGGSWRVAPSQYSSEPYGSDDDRVARSGADASPGRVQDTTWKTGPENTAAGRPRAQNVGLGRSTHTKFSGDFRLHSPPIPKQQLQQPPTITLWRTRSRRFVHLSPRKRSSTPCPACQSGVATGARVRSGGHRNG